MAHRLIIFLSFSVFIILYVGYKIIHKTKVIRPEDADLVTGVREIDEEERMYNEKEAAKGPQNWKQKLWDSL
jgi:amino acid transporter